MIDIKRFKAVLLAQFLVMVSLSSLAQSDSYNRGQKKEFLEADSYYIYGDYLTAFERFQKVYHVDSLNAEINFKMGDALYQLDRYKEALPYLKKGRAFSLDADYILGKIYIYLDRLELASEMLNEFEAKYEDGQTKYPKQSLKILQNKIATAYKLKQNPEVLNIINLGSGVNTADDEYVPLISLDESILIFTSRRLTDGNELDPTGRPFENIYYSTKGRSGWKQAELLPGKVNSSKHDASVGLSPDGTRLFLFRTNENLYGGDLYESYLQDSIWGFPERLPPQINNYETVEPSASLSLDGRTLYFSSNRPGGYGGFDIYRVVKLPNGEWSLPLNLGDTINTILDEDSPFIHPDGKTLYFSSLAHENMGGFDVFKSRLSEDGSWSIPENLGYPTNTTKDDIHFVISSNEQHGYYASDKEGGFGGYDLYMIDYLERELRNSVIRSKVLNQKTGEAVYANISLVELESGDLSGSYISNPKNGKFIFLVDPGVEYDMLIEADGFEDKFEVVRYSKEELQETQFLMIELNPLPEANE